MTSRILLAGMPGSGKTTFIAAFRYLLVSNETPTCLRLTSLSASEKHLNNLERRWIACERVERTPGPSNTWLSFEIMDPESGNETEVVIPDLSGEVYRQPASVSKCRRSLYDVFDSVGGLMLFTNADRGHDDDLIDDICKVLTCSV